MSVFLAIHEEIPNIPFSKFRNATIYVIPYAKFYGSSEILALHNITSCAYGLTTGFNQLTFLRVSFLLPGRGQ